MELPWQSMVTFGAVIAMQDEPLMERLERLYAVLGVEYCPQPLDSSGVRGAASAQPVKLQENFPPLVVPP